jgi:hypothetical protein
MEKSYQDRLTELKSNFETNLRQLPEKRKKYNEKVALYQKRSNYTMNLKSCQQRFLDATTGIDFDAAVVKKGSVSTFSNAPYEKKNNLWKACFRAGKESTEAARSFAQKWISELN